MFTDVGETLTEPYGYWKAAMMPLQNLQAEQLSQSVFTGAVLQPSDHLCGLLCTCYKSSMSFLY